MGRHKVIDFGNADITLESIDQDEMHPACIAVREQQIKKAKGYCNRHKVQNIIVSARDGIVLGCIISSGLQIGWPITAATITATVVGRKMLQMKLRKVKANGDQTGVGIIER